jgi:chemotaxis protein MotB
VIEQVKVETQKGTVRFTILNEVLFGLGQKSLGDEGKKAIDRVIDVLKKDYPDRRIVVEGHTDNSPYSDPAKYSNWELSSERAIAVLRYMLTKGIKPENISAAGFGEFSPIADNATDQGKKQNRRAVIVVQPPGDEIVKDRPTGAAVGSPAKTPEKPVDKPAAKPAEKPAEKPADKPAAKPPADGPADELKG